MCLSLLEGPFLIRRVLFYSPSTLYRILQLSHMVESAHATKHAALPIERTSLALRCKTSRTYFTGHMMLIKYLIAQIVYPVCQSSLWNSCMQCFKTGFGNSSYNGAKCKNNVQTQTQVWGFTASSRKPQWLNTKHVSVCFHWEMCSTFRSRSCRSRTHTYAANVHFSL